MIKQIGSAFIIIALAVFISTLFLNTYRLTSVTIRQSGMSAEQQAIILENTVQLREKSLSKFKFIKELKLLLNSTNNEIIAKYSIDDGEIEKMVAQFGGAYKLSYTADNAVTIFQGDDVSGLFKKKGVKDYTFWMEGKTYSTSEELKNELSNTLLGYNNNIVYLKGMDDYSIGNYTLNLTLASGNGLLSNNLVLFFFLTFILAVIGALMFIIPSFFSGNPGIKNNYIFKNPLNSRGWSGILLGTFLILFYVFLYFYPVYIVEWIDLSGLASKTIFGRATSQWFLYGFLYTLSVMVMGIRFLTKYRHNKYQQYRTYSVIFFQTIFAFILPQILFALNLPEVDLKNIWPLDYSFFYDWRIQSYQQAGGLGLGMMIWGIGLIVVGVPLVTYFFGKRWYCSWVCGCGGLAETAGDPFRHLSSKKLSSWKIERILIHSVLVFAVVMTVWVLYTTLSGKSSLIGISSYEVRKVYGFMISSVFAGVVGTGFYPLMGNRVWCRFGCPLAAYLGMVQKFKSRFRITTNGGQCISCGNCSTHCEMGIDVRWYAQRGQNIIRSSCVGCGVCAAVCPRGVLKLENKSEKGRYNEPLLLGNDGIINIRKERLTKKTGS
ncbi:MAG: 4Fe-4S binding protein [Bacteroidales bacterium]|nr:4Fe-4S binding protein [Bacteroidales bacterium]MCF8404588.1 4Fe-4S binding protein [Bacteroidales bacterium]